MLTLVTGGARSGKSRHAEALIADAPQVLYIATSQIFDDEMAARIQHHRDGRPDHWRTAERWQQLDELITPDIAPAASAGAISGVISSSSCCQRSAVRQWSGLPSRGCW
ncbi:bifunctional adenosylcobinamide kinase/adenosylcobinamide-phosphate guanylyltransferase, partial [Klebsiella variicola]|uniref:bifunctional adenosylcobinamide kinase/adenosylcobinamide-phosphate guanylyltransferase n=1 Tax=Klebsiella variicola TaxID=244366 RepID=UPI000A6F99B3